MDIYDGVPLGERSVIIGNAFFALTCRVDLGRTLRAHTCARGFGQFRTLGLRNFCAIMTTRLPARLNNINAQIAARLRIQCDARLYPQMYGAV
jgi:hypothetical protein